MINKGLFTSNTDNWETPSDFFEIVRTEFSPTLDVCADIHNKKCDAYFTKEDDGLSKDWIGTCWMNPPYGKEIGKWVRKAKESTQAGATVICLLPARTDTKWFHDYILGVAEIRFVKGRLKFGGSKSSAPFPSMLVIFRPK